MGRARKGASGARARKGKKKKTLPSVELFFFCLSSTSVGSRARSEKERKKERKKGREKERKKGRKKERKKGRKKERKK